METDKFKAFEDVCKDFIENRGDRPRVSSLISTLKKPLDDVLQEINLNEYKIPPPNTFREYSEKTYTIIINLLKKIQEILTPTVLDINYDSEEEKLKHRYKHLPLNKFNSGRLIGYTKRMSVDEADKLIDDENKFIDEKIKEIEMLKDAEPINNKKEPLMETHNAPIIKMKWAGQRNQLYDVIRQLKNGERKILNSYPEIAVFLKLNFEIFETTSLLTIQTELQRGKRPPKDKRINISKTDQPDKKNTTGNITGELSKP